MAEERSILPFVSIIIINWQNWPDTQECLESVLKLNYPNYQIILIDNGSKDGSVVKAEEFITWHQDSPAIELVKLPQNLGFAGGNNVGIKKALDRGSKYILLLNNDTLFPQKNFLKKMVEYAENHQRVGMMTPKIYYAQSYLENPRDPIIWFGGGRIDWLKLNPIQVGYNQKEKISAGKNKKPCLADWLTGCCLLVRSKMIREIGLMREDFFLYFEDTDWSFRAREKKWKLVYFPSTWILHKVARSTREFSSNYIYYNTRNKFICAWEHNGYFRKVIVLIVSFWIFFKQLIKLGIGYQEKWSVAIKNGIEDFWKHRMGKRSCV